MDTLKIDIVSDIVCPWCVIGFRNLKIAMEELQSELKCEVFWKPYELHPEIPQEGYDSHMKRMGAEAKDTLVAETAMRDIDSIADRITKGYKKVAVDKIDKKVGKDLAEAIFETPNKLCIDLSMDILSSKIRII